MKVSTKGLYAVRLMLHLAERGQGGPVSLKDISAAQGISKKYLEQIVPSLTTARLVRAIRGAQGGYQLSKPASSITMFDILSATEGTLSPVGCISEGGYTCSMAQPCMEAYMWKGLYDVMRDYLTGVTLQDIIDRESAIAADSYSI